MNGDTIACTKSKEEKKTVSAETKATAELFKKLSPKEQEAIISLIKSLLSER